MLSRRAGELGRKVAEGDQIEAGDRQTFMPLEKLASSGSGLRMAAVRWLLKK